MSTEPEYERERFTESERIYESERWAEGEQLSGEEDSASPEGQLLEEVIRETLGRSNWDALELVFRVARESSFEDTSDIRAVEEFVSAVLQDRFRRHFPGSLVQRIALSLVDSPEATVKLARLWQEARSRG